MANHLPLEPAPTPEEAAAISAALSVLAPDEAREEPEVPRRERWRLAGLLGSPPEGFEPGGSLWSYSSWKGKV